MNKFLQAFKTIGAKVWAIVSVLVLAILIVLTVLENGMFESILGTVLGGKKPILGPNSLSIYKSDYNSKSDATKAGKELNVQIEGEGAVLLLNENNALPITKEKPKVTVFGKNSVNLVYGGSGSGGLGNQKAVSLYDSLTDAGFEYNPDMKSFYDDDKASGSGRSDSPKLSDSSSASPTLDIGETPVGNYSASLRSSFKDYNDAAIVVISRIGGESWDVPRRQNTANGGIEGNHYLQLDSNEYDMLDTACMYFNKVVVLLNTLTSFQCDFIAEYNNSADKRIDAVLWIGGPGINGVEAVGQILTGKINPSGKTTDTYAADFKSNPTWVNFGDNSQVTSDGSNNTAFCEGGAASSTYNMVTYEEGVYVGYRYYETRGYEEEQLGNEDWYDENVVFPFGHGLSYTSFTQKITGVTGSLDDKLTITVEVQNKGAVSGKDVVELYVSKPYTYGGIEKSFVDLVDYAKTPLLAPNATYIATFVVDPYDLASYDYNDANGNGFNCYELEQGDYTFYISKNSHVTANAYDSETVTLGSDRQFETDPVTGNTVENRYTTDDYTDLQYRLRDFSESSGVFTDRKGMSRVDFAGSFPDALTAAEREYKTDELNGMTEKQALSDMTTNNPVKATAAPKTGAAVTTTLRDLLDEKGKASYDDPKWEAILDSLSFDDMVSLVNTGAFSTYAIPSINKNLTNDSDGPIGFVNFMPGISEHYKDNPTFACEIVIGCTWNKDLAYQMGKMVGESGIWGDTSGNGLPYTGWYAPAVNLHRSPFGGRSFEYYSEDPVLSGKMAVNVINGAKQKGVYTDLKHFALNDQETNRAGVSTYCTEQALRELYLKPFEMAVKGNDNPAEVATAKADGVTKYEGTTGIMSSFNRIGTRWTGGDYRLLTEILRSEWGFRGLVICDYKTDNSFMNSRQMVYAGNDLILASLSDLLWNDASASDPTDLAVLRNAAHNILYTTTNSNAIQLDIVGYHMEWWKSLTIALDIIAVVLLAIWGFFAISKSLGVGKNYKMVFINTFMKKKAKEIAEKEAAKEVNSDETTEANAEPQEEKQTETEPTSASDTASEAESAQNDNASEENKEQENGDKK